MAAAPKRSASDALKAAHGESTEAAETAPETTEALPPTPEFSGDVAGAPATPDAGADATAGNVESVDGGTVLVTVRSTVAMVMDGNLHRTFPHGAQLKVTKDVAERGIRLGSFDK